MGTIASTSAARISITPSDTNTSIYNVTITNANTEQSQALPSNTKQFLIRSRSNSNLRLAYASGETTSQWLSIPGGSCYKDENYYTSQTLYFQSDQAGDIVEIVVFI